MKNKLFPAILLCTFLFTSCTGEKSMNKVIDESLAFSARQYTLMAEALNNKPDLLPRTIDESGTLVTSNSGWWTSGFFPGSLWYLYEYSKDDKFKDAAIQMTSRIENEKNNTGTHDLGFMLYCSFGNGFRLTGDQNYKDVMLTGARSLSTRFRPNIGCIQSWGSRKGWQCPVIIDNMMNLEFLMWAFKQTGDSSFYKIAVTHSDTTIKNHFRPDFSTWHVVSYDTIRGKVEAKQTAQGAADGSAWSRGQSWGLYGYTVMYRETGLQRYLDQAEHIADYLINHPNLPEDKIPYWDYNAPGIPDAKKDASASAIMASALIELSGYAGKEKGIQYLNVAEKQLRSLSSPAYLAKEGENGNFILKHSVGSLPAKSEVDVPLTYADYYYIEALLRYKKLLK
ncbi:MAG TPA: glucuronyl hydrolase [Bacteroidales bacterium]|jgi:unsaturated chondroitin disaccharide hydrolase|nr:glucuronyl hydrolase [Bacteroidales bacterium]HBZ19871.1 glucuronyl hydrolase [Bacteroidales bacterium]